MAPGLARAWTVEHTASGAEVHWTAFPVSYRVDLGGVARADRRWVLRTLRRGPESWTLPQASPAAFTYAGTTSAGLVAGDGQTTFAYVTQGWPADLGDGSITAGATLLTYDDTTGEVSEADVGLNAEGFRFADETPRPDALRPLVHQRPRGRARPRASPTSAATPVPPPATRTTRR